MSKTHKVAVLCGGDSVERPVSLESGQNVYAALQSLDIAAELFDPQARPMRDIIEFDRAFNVLHGGLGENGSVAGCLNSLALPYTGSGVLACALAQNKEVCKRLWRSVGLPVPEWRSVNTSANWQQVVDALGLPLFVKPTSGGSSIGTSPVDRAEQLASAIDYALTYDHSAIVEQAITGGEYTVSLLAEETLPVVGIKTDNRFYDYQAKYESAETLLSCPCDLDVTATEQLAKLARAAFSTIQGRGWGRIDFLRDDQGHFYLLEANMNPGMTSHSLFPKAAQAAGYRYETVVKQLLDLACTD